MDCMNGRWIWIVSAAALLLSTPLSAGDQVLFKETLSKKLCPKAPLTAKPGFDEYIWYEGPDLDEIVLNSTGDPMSKQAPLRKLATTEKPKLPADKFKGHSVVYLRQVLKTDDNRKHSKYAKIKITHAKAPKITVESATEVKRGEEVELKTKEEFKSYSWKYLGIPVSAEKALKDRWRLRDKEKQDPDPLDVPEYLKHTEADKDSKQYSPEEKKKKKEAEEKEAKEKERNDNIAALRARGWRCIQIKTGKLVDCDTKVWTEEKAPTKEMHFLRVTLPKRGGLIDRDLGKGKTAVHHPLINSALYAVEVKDSNRCPGAKLREVEVDQHTLDLVAGVDFARREETVDPPDDSPTPDPMDPMPDPMTMDSATTEEAGDLFSNSAGFVGVRWRQYVRNFLGVYGDTRFGGSNIAATDSSNPTGSLTQADTFQADFGIFYDHLCGPSTQVCLYTKGELGVIVPENELVMTASGTPEERLIDDQLLRSFVGFGWRYHKPDSIFHRTYTEIGFGRSENFRDDTGRWKLRAEAFFDLTNTWDIFLRGEIDNDGGNGPDDLRVVFGASRDLSFLGDVLVNVLGLGEKKKEDKK